MKVYEFLNKNKRRILKLYPKVEFIYKETPIESDVILFITKHISESGTLHFCCDKKEIDKKISEEFSVWTSDTNNIRTFDCDFISNKYILGYDIYIDENLLLVDVIDSLMDAMFRNGITDEDKIKNKEKLFKMLDEIDIQNIKEEDCIDADVFFEMLHKEIYDNMSKEEQERHDERERKRNKEAENLLSYLKSRYNHKTCIMIIEKYYIDKLTKETDY